MIRLFTSLLLITLPALPGYVFLQLFRPRLFTRIEQFFLALGLGSGYITLSMLLLSLLRIPFNIPVLTLLLLLPTAIYGVVYQRKGGIQSTISGRCSTDLKDTHIDPTSWFLIIISISSLLLMVFFTYIVKFELWDNWALWGFKAKVFYHHRMIPFDQFHKLLSVYGHWDYPQHVPLYQAWVYVWAGRWDDRLVRLMFPLYYTGLCFMVFYGLRRFVSMKYAALGLFLLATYKSIQNWTIGALTEPVLLFYYFAGFTLLQRWIKTRQPSLLILSGLFSGLAGWTKNEGVFFFAVNILILIYHLCREKGAINAFRNKDLWKYIITGGLVILPWTLVKFGYHLQNDIINPHLLDPAHIMINLNRLGVMSVAFLAHWINLPFCNVLWFMFLVCIIYSIFSSRIQEASHTLLALMVHLLMIAFLFIIYTDIRVFITDTMHRVLLAPAILAMMYCCLVFQPPEND